MAEQAKKPSIFSRIGKFFRDLKSETKKIVWPTRKQVINNTLVVIVAVIVIGAFIWGLDELFGWIRSLIIGLA